MHLPSRVSKFKSQFEKSKPMNILDRASPSRNLGINPKELHTPKSTPKKLEGDDGDMKKKLELDRVFCETKVWQEADTMFQELSKWKSIFVGKL
jgi:hypothetical protein